MPETDFVNEPYVVKVETDPDVEDPSDHAGAWRLYSFNRRHASFTDPESLGLGDALDPKTGDPKVVNPGLRTKLRVGLAFFLSYYEHGECSWFLKGEGRPGVEFRWDGNRNAGLLVWEHDPSEMGAKTHADRAKDAESFLDTYTDWCNGHGLYYSVEDSEGNLIDSRGGFYASDEEYVLRENVAPNLVGKTFTVAGDAGHYESALRRYVAELENKKKAAAV